MLSSTVEAYERKLKEAARNEGRDEGLQQGRHAALLKTARKMLDSGSTVEYVVAVTELPRVEVERLAGQDSEDSNTGDNTDTR
jgi:predicted transposase/invertase (TIGR01784 family)